MDPAVFELRHRRAIVTGAASGIGRAAAILLRRGGATVVGLDIAPPPGGTADGITLLQVDITDEAQVRAGVAEAARRLGGLDLLVNSAGIEIEAPLAQLRAEDLDRMYAVNVRGLVLVTREAQRHFTADAPDSYRIINVASELAYLGRAGASGYCATKAAVLGLTRSWARELAPHGLVNAVAPGPVDTPLLRFSAMSPQQQALEQDNPLGRIGTADEVAAVIAFLASAGASFITGQCYGADGGAAMR
jgi:3-oxoacyl-[acyl-carrier protein] reductase